MNHGKQLYNTPTAPLPCGATIGILGGGQLGWMLGLAAKKMGYKILCWDPDIHCPCANIADIHETGGYNSPVALDNFTQHAQVALVEFENIPIALARQIAQKIPFYPNPDILEMAQARHLEKAFFNNNGIATAPYFYIENDSDIAKAMEKITLPGILKTDRMGYDGKGQFAVNDWGEYNQHARPGMVLEQKIAFLGEFSVLFARNGLGENIFYQPSANYHSGGIIRTAEPLDISTHKNIQQTIHQCQILWDKMDFRGIICVEFFWAVDGKILVNECAPRPHNSYHWSMTACHTGQFEQYIRIATGMGMGNSAIHTHTQMVNIIGDEIDNMGQYTQNPMAKVYNYGKTSTKPGRKMGHVNILCPKF